MGRQVTPMSRKTSEGHHNWVIATAVEVPENIARRGVQRGVVRLSGPITFDVMDTYCGTCRQAYIDVADQPCKGNVIGGPVGERKKRRHDHNCAAAGCEPIAKVAATASPVDATLTG